MNEELLSKLRDPKFYLENFTKIKGKQQGALIPFILNEAQKDLFNTIMHCNRCVICKARQLGFSTAMVGYFYHDTIMNPGTTTAIIGYNSALTAELLDKVKVFYKTTPDELKPTIHYNSKYEISFPKIDSKILVLSSSDNVGRGYTLNNVLATELSSWEKADEKMMTLEASVPIGGKMVVESTPKGIGNCYHRMMMGEDNGYVKKKYGWWWGYSRQEIDLIKKRMNNPEMFAQEFEMKFLTYGRSVFDMNLIEEQQKNILKIGDTVIDEGVSRTVVEEDKLRIYKRPKAEEFYVCGVDVGEGVTGGDNSVATIWNRRTGEEVAAFRGLLAPEIFGEKLNKWGRLYNNALMVVEINNHGLTTVTTLKNLLYPSIYFRPAKFDQMGMPSSNKMGWKTTKMTRPLMIDDLAQAIRDKNLIIHSKELLDEMSVFVYNDSGDMQPQTGFHDDAIFSAAIAVQGFKVMYHKKLEQLNYEAYLPTSFAY